ncbi:MAG: hypothetical protein ABEJ27_03295 [Halodesulfurarchaeum sp.]
MAQLRNIRAVLLFDPADPPPSETWSWLQRKHRYRNVGLAPAVAEETDPDALPDGETITTLYIPIETVDRIASGAHGSTPPWLAQSIYLASAYVAPILVQPPLLDSLTESSLWKLYPDIELTEEQLLRHLRILGYGMVDFQESMVESGYEAVVEGRIPGERERRQTVTEEDGKDRCWRLFDEDQGEPMDDERWVGGYFDTLSLLREDDIELLASNPDGSMLLGVVGGIVLDLE